MPSHVFRFVSSRGPILAAALGLTLFLQACGGGGGGGGSGAAFTSSPPASGATPSSPSASTSSSPAPASAPSSSAPSSPTPSGGTTPAAPAASPTALQFSTQPSGVVAGVPFSVSVTIVDGSGATVTAGSFAVSLALAANPYGATLGGTLTVTSSQGVATFSGLTIDRQGSGFTLRASSGALTSATSAAFASGSPYNWQLVLPQDSPGSPPRMSGMGLAWDHANKLYMMSYLPSPGCDLWSFDLTSQQWTRVLDGSEPGDPSRRRFFSLNLTWAGSRLLCLGGYTPSGDPLNDLYSFDPATKQWTLLMADGAPGAPDKSLNLSNLTWTGSRALAFGHASSAVWSWDPGTNTWSQLLGPAAPGPAMQLRTFAWTGSRAYAFSALDDSYWTYDPAANAWTQLIAGGAPGMPPIALGCMYTAWDGNMVIFHTRPDWNRPETETWEYDPVRNTWSKVVGITQPGTPIWREAGAAAWTGDALWLFGGDKLGTTSTDTNELWRFGR